MFYYILLHFTLCNSLNVFIYSILIDYYIILYILLILCTYYLHFQKVPIEEKV